jgi:hypothetical protein
VLVSPWIAPQVVKTLCDHTSLLRSLTEKWGLGPLGARTAHATDVFGALVRTAQLRTDTPRRIGDNLAGEMSPMNPPTDHQRALEELSSHIVPTPGLTPRERAERLLEAP